MVVFVMPVTDDVNLSRLNAIQNTPDHVTQVDMEEEIIAGFLSTAGIQNNRNTHLIPVPPIMEVNVHFVCFLFAFHNSC